MFGSVVEVTVEPQDNITLYCDCKAATGVYIVWFRNCSHESQPTLIMKTIPRQTNYNPDVSNFLNPVSNFDFVWNLSSNSYDLQITNFTASDEGLYYCGTEETKVEVKGLIMDKTIRSYGNITRLICSKYSLTVCTVCSEY